MDTREDWPWKGTVRITVTNLETGEQTVEEFPNLITDAGRNHLRALLHGTITDGQIHYVAIGTSNTAPANGQTQLGAETLRKAVTAQINNAGAGNLTTRTFVTANDAVGTAIAEIGWFAGAGATSAANSGTMIARVLYSHTKTNLESIQVDRTDQTG